MSDEIFRIVNKEGYAVELPLPVAKELFGMLDLDAVFKAARQDKELADADVESPSSDDDEANAEPIKAEDVEYSSTVLDVVRNYAMLPKAERTSAIPRPLTQDLRSVVTAEEMDLIKAAEAGDYHVDLLNCAMYLRFAQLTALCAAYMAMRIDEIAKAAPSIMEGAERIRGFLHMENEWTPEEMEHLRKEMEYAKSVDPNVY